MTECSTIHLQTYLIFAVRRIEKLSTASTILSTILDVTSWSKTLSRSIYSMFSCLTTLFKDVEAEQTFCAGLKST